jgi:Nif-specific regulatory protein
MRAQLVIETGEGAPEICELDPGQRISLGRNRNNHIILNDRHSSRWHAEIYSENGRWFLRDRQTLNGTRLNGRRIEGPTALANGDVIRIGDTCLRVSLDAAADATARSLQGLTTPETPCAALPSTDPHNTLFQPDELSALYSFMAVCVEETSPRKLIEAALAQVHSQTRATITGFHSLDPDNPLPKMVLPALASVDVHLSRQLTRKAQRTRRLVWLGGGSEDGLHSDSLIVYRDALCVPLYAGATPLGALHVYMTGRSFTQPEVRFCEVLASYLAKSLHVLRARRSLEAENSRLRVHAPATEDELIGDSPAMRQLRQQVARLAPSAGNVVIVGESGSGKELVALLLHRLSPRAEAPLVPVNCAAIAANLIESELFGHCRGAFTGADCDHSGCFQQADEGTLFLDEIGELSPECQAKLLRAIEGKRFRPLGGESEVAVDVRVIAATHRDLEALVRQDRFRRDLFYRLGVTIRVPPLREHAEDIPALVEHFLPRLCLEYCRSARLTPAALRRLQEYSWPGNVRQLRSVLENAVAMASEEVIDTGDLRLPEEPGDGGSLPSLNLEELEARAIREALRRSGGTLIQAAKLLGIHRETLASKMKQYGIPKQE